MAYYALEPFGARQEDYRFGTLLRYQLAMAGSKKDVPAFDFFPVYDPDKVVNEAKTTQRDAMHQMVVLKLLTKAKILPGEWGQDNVSEQCDRTPAA